MDGSQRKMQMSVCGWEGGRRGVQEGWNEVLLLFFSAEIESDEPRGCSGHAFLQSRPTGGGGGGVAGGILPQ